MNKVVIYLKASKEAYLGVFWGEDEQRIDDENILSHQREKKKVTMCICTKSRSEYVFFFCLAMLFTGK